MRYFNYTNYQSGGSGLSNGIMSIEVGVVLAHLTNRLLILDGNVPPPANIVAYSGHVNAGRVNNARPSRVTDLIDIPVPWVEPDAVDWQGLDSLQLTDLPLSALAFYFPRTLDISSRDARSFARDREHWLTITPEYDRIPVLRLAETVVRSGVEHHRDNLCWYSYLFYFDNETRRSVYRLLQGMQAKAPFLDLARRVARDLGPFNAVHLRRGDFKVTYGVTTLDRKPHEAIEAMDQLFDRKDPLVIVTDERDDAFFNEIKLAYRNHHFIDWHILDNYAADFAALPQTDSLCLAHLSQLVAAESKEFIGTMTSTFTGLIQRYRGNRGKAEKFRFLWNELPDSDEDVERGRHAISQCIPLDRGQMIEQAAGPYSWNRVSPRLAAGWMREWPESFLLPGVVATGALPGAPVRAPELVTPIQIMSATPQLLHVSFENLQVAVSCNEAATLKQLGVDLGVRADTTAANVITTFSVTLSGNEARIEQLGVGGYARCDRAQLSARLKESIARLFAAARHKYAWLRAGAFAKQGRGLMVAGDTNEAFRLVMEQNGWDLLDADLCTVRLDDLMIVPLGARGPSGATALHSWRAVTPLRSLVIANRAALHLRTTILSPLSPAAAVAGLIRTSLDFSLDQGRAMAGLCRVIEQRPAAHVAFSQPGDAAIVISRWADSLQEAAA